MKLFILGTRDLINTNFVTIKPPWLDCLLVAAHHSLYLVNSDYGHRPDVSRKSLMSPKKLLNYHRTYANQPQLILSALILLGSSGQRLWSSITRRLQKVANSTAV